MLRILEARGSTLSTWKTRRAMFAWQGARLPTLCIGEEYNVVLGSKVIIGAMLSCRGHVQDGWSLGKLIHHCLFMEDGVWLLMGQGVVWLMIKCGAVLTGVNFNQEG